MYRHSIYYIELPYSKCAPSSSNIVKSIGFKNSVLLIIYYHITESVYCTNIPNAISAVLCVPTYKF